MKEEEEEVKVQKEKERRIKGLVRSALNHGRSTAVEAAVYVASHNVCLVAAKAPISGIKIRKADASKAAR